MHEIRAYNAKVIEEFRANAGRVGGPLADTSILLLHHIGARTGTERVTPVAYTRHHGDRLVIVASNGGSPTDPSWSHNLRAHPTVDVEVGSERFTVLAQELTGAARAELWPSLVAAAPAVGAFQAATTRRIPVFALRRLGADG
jgi:deazaflavin-dependent oxidoreductase (nitroreductase family)